MGVILHLIISLCFASAFGGGQIHYPDQDDQTLNVVEDISQKLDALTLRINKKLHRSTHYDDIVLFSPINIAEALSVLLLGANGNTSRQIERVLGIKRDILPNLGCKFLIHKKSKNADKKITSATGIFVQSGYPVRKEYQKETQDLFSSQSYNLDFENDAENVQNFVNNWVANATQNVIENIVTSTPAPKTKLLIVSALYFQSPWEQPFTSYDRMPFYPYGVKSNSTVTVDAMLAVGKYPYYYDTILKCRILGLPYKDKSTTMFIILPDNSSGDKLRQFVKNLQRRDMERLLSHMYPTDAMFLMPKMKLTTKISLKEPLQKLGINDVFDPFKSDLSRISSVGHSQNSSSTTPELYADEILHKVVIDISETGTEAAAATSINIARSGGRVTFKIEIPFLFFIRNTDLKLNLFWGTVFVPKPTFP